MQHKSKSWVSAERESQGRFGVGFENNFVLSEDGHLLVAPDAMDARRLLVEDLRRASGFGFGENGDAVLTLFLDPPSRTLLAGDFEGRLVEYRLDLRRGRARTAQRHGDLGIGRVSSACGSRGLVFLGGQSSRVRVFDLGWKRMLAGRLETAVQDILSLRVCEVRRSGVCLAVLGGRVRYSRVRSDLFDLGGFLGKVPYTKGQGNGHELLLTQRNSQGTEGKPGETLEEKLARLERRLARGMEDLDALATRNKELEKENRALEKEKASLKESVSALVKARGEMREKLSEAESRLAECEGRLRERLDRRDSIRAGLERARKTSLAQIGRLGLKLRILAMSRKGGKSREPGNRRQAMGQSELAEVVRDLEIRLIRKTRDCTDMRNVLRQIFAENSRLEGEVREGVERVDRVSHELLHSRAANREG